MLTFAPITLAMLVGTTASAASTDTSKLGYVANLDYSTNAISVYAVSGGVATLANKFVPVRPRDGSVNGITIHDGLIYTAINATTSKPCASCLLVYGLDGKVHSEVDAPILPGAPGAPQITDLAIDSRGEVFLSDYGQQAVYFFAPSKNGWKGPSIVVQGTQNAASVAVVPDGHIAYIQGGCGFVHARVYTRQPSGGWQSGNCFGIGTIAFIGTSVDGHGDVASPVDGVPGLISIGNPNGHGIAFTVPDFLDGIGGVAFARDDLTLYVADATKEIVYAYRRPDLGWLSRRPHLRATYTGFKALDIIATMP